MIVSSIGGSFTLGSSEAFSCPGAEGFKDQNSQGETKRKLRAFLDKLETKQEVICDRE